MEGIKGQYSGVVSTINMANIKKISMQVTNDLGMLLSAEAWRFNENLKSFSITKDLGFNKSENSIWLVPGISCRLENGALLQWMYNNVVAENLDTKTDFYVNGRKFYYDKESKKIKWDQEVILKENYLRGEYL